jgi:hypothetical protein
MVSFTPRGIWAGEGKPQSSIRISSKLQAFMSFKFLYFEPNALLIFNPASLLK